jgi:diguanylate cyclase (GGDEF)-like protein
MIGFWQSERFSLRRFRIGTRLIIGFGSILLILVAMAGINRVLNDQSKKTLIGGLEVAEKKIRLAATMKTALLEGGIYSRDIGLTSDWDSIEKAHQLAVSQRIVFLNARNDFLATGLTAEEERIFSRLAEVDEQLQGPIKDAIAHALGFNQEDAAKILTTRAAPLQRQATAEINKLVDAQQAAMDQVLVKYDADDARLRTLLLIFCGIALAAGALLAWVTTLSIIYPLAEAVSVAKEVAGGGLSPQVRIVGNDEVTQLMVALKEMVGCLSTAHNKLRDLSRTDGLTGVYNRAYFNECFDMEWRRSRRNQASIGVLMIDIDHFKNVNDTHGHPGGDACLKQVANTMQLAVRRPGDEIFRYGGEEFVILLPNTDADGAAHIGERIRQQVEALQVVHDGKTIPLTVSVGVAAGIPDAVGGSDFSLIGDADKALYQAKTNGRNRVCVFGEIQTDGQPVAH